MDRTAAKFGFVSATVACGAAIGYGVAQLLQVIGAVAFPLDNILIFGFSLAIATPFMLAMLALHHVTPESRKFWSHAGLLFAVMYAVYVSLMYVVQLAVAIPLSVRGQASPWLAVNRDSLFWALDGIGYICMGIAAAFAAFAFERSRPQRMLRAFFQAHALTTLPVGIVYFYPHFSVGLLFIASPWIITAPGSMLLLARFFRNAALRTQQR